MKLHMQTQADHPLFTAHGPGYVTVSGERHEQPLVVTRSEVHTDWTARDFATLTPAHFDYFLALQPEVLLLGTGPTQQFAHPNLYRTLLDARISIEFMDTPAACRTYNILVAEDRRVVAAVLL